MDAWRPERTTGLLDPWPPRWSFSNASRPGKGHNVKTESSRWELPHSDGKHLFPSSCHCPSSAAGGGRGQLGGWGQGYAMMQGSKELAGSGQAHKGPCLLCEAVPRECHRQIGTVAASRGQHSSMGPGIVPGAGKEGPGSRQESWGQQRPLPPTTRCRKPPQI